MARTGALFIILEIGLRLLKFSLEQEHNNYCISRYQKIKAAQ